MIKIMILCQIIGRNMAAYNIFHQGTQSSLFICATI